MVPHTRGRRISDGCLISVTSIAKQKWVRCLDDRMTGSLQNRIGVTAGLVAKRFVDGELANRYLHGSLVDQLLVDERVDASESLSRWNHIWCHP
jgi:hypothetical protein